MQAASGYVILAHQRQDELARRLTDWKRRTGKKVPVDLEEHLARIRKAGYEKKASYEVKGVINISFPIFDRRGAALAALTIPYMDYSTSSVALRDVIGALKKTAGKVNAAIGGKAPSEV
jgi:DNA-binding IclR family transcriptional regulator